MSSKRGAVRTWGYWTEHKLDVLSRYLEAFTTASKRASGTVYLDLFAGQPENASRETGMLIDGSAARALSVSPPFHKVLLFELPDRAAALNEHLRRRFPGREFKIYPGDCNEEIRRALADLRNHRKAATFAFIDQQGTEVRWETLRRLAEHKVGPFKVELWMLFAHAQLPRGLRVRQDTDEDFARQVDRMLGSTEWRVAYRARVDGKLSAEQFRDELTNCFRWKLERVLGYEYTHAFELKNVSGTPIYTMVFATDNATGNKIMSHLYGQASQQSEGMRAEALARRRADRENAKGELTLFAPLPRQVDLDPDKLYAPTLPHAPYGFDDDCARA
jgi:three-Cys-motif partner protein